MLQLNPTKQILLLWAIMCIKPSIGEELYGVMESTNLMDKYAVAVQRNCRKAVGHFLLEKSKEFVRKTF